MSAQVDRRTEVRLEQEAATRAYISATTAEEVRAALVRAQDAAARADALRNGNGRKRNDLVGARYGALLVEGRGAPGKSWLTKWLCLCDCGRRWLVEGCALRLGAESCVGCRADARAGAREEKMRRLEKEVAMEEHRRLEAALKKEQAAVRARLDAAGRAQGPMPAVVVTQERRPEVLRALGRSMRQGKARWTEVVELCGEEIAAELRAAEMMEKAR